MLVVALSLLIGDAANAQPAAVTVFKGRPVVKISEGGVERTPEQLATATAANLECVISQIGERFYLASRENLELVRVERGGFVTYIALNGAAYVRVITPAGKEAASIAESKTETTFDYVEHLLIGLRSVTYYGKTQ